MKFSESWLREFVSPALTTQQLVDQLTMAGLEVDGFEPVASECSKVVVGEILSVALHPDADKLVVCKVDAGDQTHQVVCGAPNAKQGVKIPFALVGAKLDDFKIKKAKLRGVESFGMLCSERELGISDKHEGLMELPVDAPVGTDIREYLQLNDAIVDLDLTPNRSDCLGMVGLARETGLVNSLDVKQVSATVIEATINDVFAVELEASTACPRFVGRVIRGINLKAETPLWMREKLRRSEIRSIDPIVDVTNFVMLELGQPLHAYDLATLSGKIQVRQSKEGERLTLLDGSEISLVEDTLLIADASGPIGMAGIMGGHTTSVTDSTVDIFLESAFFLPTAIAGRARSYGLNTDASHRFERGVDWQGQRRAIERATDLVLQICGGQAAAVVETVIETELPHTALVELRLQRVNKMLGVEIKASQVEDMLTRLGFEFCQLEISADGRDEDPVWQVSSPSHRFDISIEADLIEEISRVYGYNNLPVKTPKTNLTMAPIEEGLLSTNQLKDQLVARGYQEAITYSFVDPVVQAVLDPTNDPIELANPLSSEMAVMRTTLWAGLIRALQHNINRQQSRVRLFETGLSFQQSNSASELLMQNIRQEPMLAGVLCGSRNVESWGNSTDLVDFYDVKGDVETLLALTGLATEFVFEAAVHPVLHPGQTAKLLRGDQPVGFIGLMDPRVQKKLGIEQDVYLFEFKIAGLVTKCIPDAMPLSKFPEVRRDIAVIVDNAVSASDISECVRGLFNPCFKNLKLFDVYHGKGIDPNRKSLALGLTFQHPSRTLTDNEINTFIEVIVEALSTRFGASLRN